MGMFQPKKKGNKGFRVETRKRHAYRPSTLEGRHKQRKGGKGRRKDIMIGGKTTNLDDLKRNGRTVLISCLDVSLEVYVQELENEV